MDASSRRTFLGALAGASVAVGSGSAPSLADDAPSRRARRPRALILAGGANRGAYEAGVIAGLVARAGLRDGEPLDFEGVYGTSIGAINGYFVATAQYTRLRNLWREIAGEKIFALKPRYEKIGESSSGVVTRAYQGISLGFGLTKNVTGVLDRDRIEAFLARIIDPTAPVHLPLYIATTNLTRQAGQTFVRQATTARGKVIQQQNDDLVAAFTKRQLRAVGDDILVRILLASAALPTLIDPVDIPRPDGSGSDAYVDGGVTDNVPLELARRCAANLFIVLVDPLRGPNDVHYKSALEVGLGVFETMQQRILVYQMLLAIAETTVQSTPLTDAAGLLPMPIVPSVIRPVTPLPGEIGDFDNLAYLDAAWERGYTDGAQGWPPFVASMLSGAPSPV